MNQGWLLRHLDRRQDGAVILGAQAADQIGLRFPLLNQGNGFWGFNVLVEVALAAARLHTRRLQLGGERPDR